MRQANFDAFREAARLALKETLDFDDDSPEIKAFDAKGGSFNFSDNGGADSLDMLDIVFSINKQLNIKIDIDAMVKDKKELTLENLYGSVPQPAL